MGMPKRNRRLGPRGRAEPAARGCADRLPALRRSGQSHQGAQLWLRVTGP